MRQKFLHEEDGFTLPEMLVSMTVMVVVLMALYSVFDMSVRVFGFGNDKVEATENARLGLEKMAREIRSAYPYDKINGQSHLFWNSASPTTPALPASSSVTCGNDLNGNRKIDVASEQITYSLSGTTLQRNGQPAVEFVQDVDGDGTALSFQYLDANGNTATSEAAVAMVRIKLEVAVDRGIHEQPVTQVLQTKVALRNRGDQG
jgi:prepilin-type N-terminal cleavage/methylation domain-containing protein